MSSKSKTVTPTVIGSIPLPSSDLIQYRFDQLDAKWEQLDNKLEKLISGGITKADVLVMRAENDKRVTALETRVEILERSSERNRGAIEAKKDISTFTLIIIGIICAFVGGIVAALIEAHTW